MEINGRWDFDDLVSGLRLSVIEGEHTNRLHIEITGEPPVVNNRDFFFRKDGSFEGTGSAVGEKDEDS